MTVTHTPPEPAWLQAFEAALQKYYGITLNDVGENTPNLYVDLDPSDAVLMYGEDLGLQRIDQGPWK